MRADDEKQKRTLELAPHYPLRRANGEDLGVTKSGDHILIFDFIGDDLVEGEIWDARGPWATLAVVSAAAIRGHTAPERRTTWQQQH